jgi:hypothetical protein
MLEIYSNMGDPKNIKNGSYLIEQPLVWRVAPKKMGTPKPM